MDNATQSEDFDERRLFEDRPSDDRETGPARAVDISGRCVGCWGPVSGTKDEGIDGVESSAGCAAARSTEMTRHRRRMPCGVRLPKTWPQHGLAAR